MDAYRPITAELWRETDSGQRARLVRHLRPWWDVHRHRIADRIAQGAGTGWKQDGRLDRPCGPCAPRDGRRGGRGPSTGTPRAGAARSACAPPGCWTAPVPATIAARDPLTGPLIAAGRARLDPLRLGLDLDAHGRVLHADGAPDPALFVLGPPARAAFWETIAVPDIRKRIEDVAAALDA